MKPVNIKKDFVKRFMLGEFGNRGPMWDTIEEWDASGYEGLLHIRNRTAGGPTYYDVPSFIIRDRYKSAGASPEEFYLAAMAPTDKTLLQGEVQRTHRGLEFYGTCVKKPMRAALAECSFGITGIMSVSMLRSYLCVDSYEWLHYLLDVYQDHVVEFSTYSVNWGTTPNFNTVFWEVRNY